MPAPAIRIRVVRSRGHDYAQEVVYEWDSRLKRGRTRVLRTLGPLRPRRGKKGEKTAAREIETRIRAQRRESESRLPRTHWPDSAKHEGAGTAGRTELTIAKSTEEKQPGWVPRHSITGSKGVKDFDEQVLRYLQRSKRPQRRRDVYWAASRAGVRPPNARLSLRRHISFALTRLRNAGLIIELERPGIGGLLQYRAVKTDAQ